MLYAFGRTTAPSARDERAAAPGLGACARVRPRLTPPGKPSGCPVSER